MSTNGHHMSSLVTSVILISSNYQFMKSMTTMQRILLGNKGGQQCKIIVQRKSITIKILSTGCAFPQNTLQVCQQNIIQKHGFKYRESDTIARNQTMQYLVVSVKNHEQVYCILQVVYSKNN